MAINIDMSDIDESFIPALTAIIDEFTDLTNVLTTIVEDVLIPETEDIFSTDGRWTWDPTSRPNPILRDTLRLYESLTSLGHPDNITDIGTDYVEFGSDVFYHDYHEEGTSRFVARPILGLWDVDSELEIVIQKWVDGILDRHFLDLLI